MFARTTVFKIRYLGEYREFDYSDDCASTCLLRKKDRNHIMNQAIVDPAELRRFAQTLRRFNEELSQNTAVIGGQLNNLAQTWRDKEHLKFSEDFNSNLKALGRFVESNESYIPYLLRKAQLIEEYLQQQ
jgi:uncharacterized protein YukE